MLHQEVALTSESSRGLPLLVMKADHESGDRSQPGHLILQTNRETIQARQA